MGNKARHIDFYPDEYVSGVAGKLNPVDQGVYWMVCSLVYSRGGPVDDDHVWMARLFADTHWRTIRGALDRLIDMGKITRMEGAGRPQIMVKRCADELQKSGKRIADAAQNGSKGGRPPKKNKKIAKPGGFSDEKLTTNHQPPTTNQEDAFSGSKEDQDYGETTETERVAGSRGFDAVVERLRPRFRQGVS